MVLQNHPLINTTGLLLWRYTFLGGEQKGLQVALDRVIKPYLTHCSFLQRIPCGWIITDAAYEYLNLLNYELSI